MSETVNETKRETESLKNSDSGTKQIFNKNILKIQCIESVQQIEDFIRATSVNGFSHNLTKIDLQSAQVYTKHVKILHHLHHLQCLRLQDCGLTSMTTKELIGFRNILKITDIDFSENEDMNEESVGHVGGFVKDVEAKNVDLSFCNIGGKKLGKFIDHCGDAKMERLQLHNQGVSWSNRETITLLKNLFRKVRKSLDISKNSLSSENISCLMDGLTDLKGLEVTVDESLPPITSATKRNEYWSKSMAQKFLQAEKKEERRRQKRERNSQSDVNKSSSDTTTTCQSETGKSPYKQRKMEAYKEEQASKEDFVEHDSLIGENLADQKQSATVKIEEASKFREKPGQLQFGSGKDPSADFVSKLLKMERQYSLISPGSAVLNWLKWHEKEKDHIRRIISIYGLSLVNYKMQQSDWKYVLGIMEDCVVVESFAFSSGLDSLKLALQESTSLKFQILELIYVGPLNKSEILCFMEFAKLSRTTSLVFQSSRFGSEEFEEIKEKISEMKPQIEDLKDTDKDLQFKLKICKTESIPNEGMKFLAEIPTVLKNISVRLALCNCGLDDKCLKTLKDNLGDSKLAGIDISNNSNIHEEGFKTLGEIVGSSGASSVNMTNCLREANHLDKFVAEVVETRRSTPKNFHLNLSSNRALCVANFKSINDAVEKLDVKQLSLADCAIKSFGLEKSVDILDVSYNPKLDSLRKAATQASKRLYASNCMLLKQELDELLTLLRNRKKKKRRNFEKFTNIDLSDTRTRVDGSHLLDLGDDFKGFVQKITFHCPGTETIPLAALKREIRGIKELEISLSPCVKFYIPQQANTSIAVN